MLELVVSVSASAQWANPMRSQDASEYRVCDTFRRRKLPDVLESV